MKNLLQLFLIAVFQAIIHIGLNWWIALCIPLLFVAWKARENLSAWWWPVATTVLSWMGLLAVNFIVAGEAVGRMIPAVAGLMKLPAFALPLVSLVLAALVGLLAGLVGLGLSGLVSSKAKTDVPSPTPF
jgi:hypothetical protein